MSVENAILVFFIIIFVINPIPSFVVAYAAKHKTIHGFSAFLISLFLTPLFGILIVINSPNKK